MKPKLWRLLGALCALLGLAHGASVGGGPRRRSTTFETSDACDWEGSGLEDHGSDRVVVPIYLRCNAGNVRWLYPKNALQVVLRHGPSTAPEFRGCIRIAANTTARVRIFVEGIYESLHKLYAFDDGRPRDLVRCFVSHGGQVALYIEAEQSVPNYSKELLELDYHLEPVASRKALLDEQDECRPCSDREMHTLYCSSDFIVRGVITSMHTNAPLERTELRVKASEVVKGFASAVRLESLPASAMNNKTIVLHRPAKCHSQAGLGSEFLFLGRWVLGNPIIKCAPKVVYWKRVRSRAIATASNQCQLN